MTVQTLQELLERESVKDSVCAEMIISRKFLMRFAAFLEEL